MNKLKQAIEDTGKSQAAVARDMQVPIASLCRWVSGTREPNLITRLKVNGYFGKEIFPIAGKDLETVKLCRSIKGLKED